MTVVALPDSRFGVFAKQAHDTASLRVWLAGRWAILFSHPDDFAQEQLEMDRWVSVVSRSFGGRGVAAVALARAGSHPEDGWLRRVAALEQESAAILALQPPTLRAPPNPSECALATQIGRCGPRFAMVVDSRLYCRRALSYRLPAELPSPLDLIGWAMALRRRDRDAQSTPDTPEPALAARARWATSKLLTHTPAGRANRMA